MTSIRTKLFLNISFQLILFVLAAWCLSALFLENFYISNKKSSLIESGQLIDALYTAGDPNISLEIERIAGNIGAGILVISEDGYVKYSSFERQANPKTRGNPHRIFRPDVEQQPGFAAAPPPPEPIVVSREVIDGNSVVEMRHDPALNISFIDLRRQLKDNDILTIRLPVAAVKESAAYAVKFMAFCGILSIIAGCIWAYFFARKFTVPFQELSEVAASMAELDFSRRCRIGSNDEAGKLGQSINNLSSQLNKAIGELHEKNKQLMADVEKERRLDKLRQNFISSVSHDLKTPISLILGYAEGLKDDVAHDPADREYYCSVIADEAEKTNKLVNDLLDLSQIESGYFRLDRKNFDLSLLLDDIVLKYRTILQEKQFSLEVDKEATLPADGDELRIEQVIQNLLNNAIVHTDNAWLIKIAVVTADDKFRVNVFNTGSHIPEESIDNLWLSFYKVDRARTRGRGGHGLGLSIVKAIQELHGNAYGVENVDGGVVFWFEVDKAANLAAPE
jgi:Osmosensitive K+ channel histidine kinase